MTLGVCPHPPRWPTAGTLRRPTFVRVAEPRCHTSLAYIIRTATFALILLAGQLLERTDGLLSFALQSCAVTHR
jgi:hypothetical protein